MPRADLPPGAARLVREDGAVVVPPALAGGVLRILLRDTTARVQADGGKLSAPVIDLLWALHSAAEGERARLSAAAGSVGGTPVARAASVEESVTQAARRMGCSESYVRRLARSGQVPARRVAGVWLITRAAGAADDESEAA